MLILRPSYCFALLLSLGALAGCVSSDRPPRSRDARGGFSVLVDGPGHPTATGVVADIGAYARARGFVRQPALPGPPVDPVTHEPIPSAPERYLLGGIGLEVSYQPATHRVSAYLHSGERGRDARSINRFYRDFDREYAGRYGSESPISETGYSDDSSGPVVPDRPAGASVPGPGGGFSGTEGPGGPGGR